LAIIFKFWVKARMPRMIRMIPKTMFIYLNNFAWRMVTLVMKFDACDVNMPTIRKGRPSPNE
jgi:hypothetical protein